MSESPVFDQRWKMVTCAGCGRRFQCTPADDYYNCTNDHDGVCEACLLRPYGLPPKDVDPNTPSGQAEILRTAAGFYPLQTVVADAMVAGADALEQLHAAQAENQQLREVLGQLWDAFGSLISSDPARAFRTDGAEIGNRGRAALEQQAALGQVDQ